MLWKFLIPFAAVWPVNYGSAEQSHLEMTPLSWDEAYAMARQTLGQLTRNEKNSLLHSTMDQAAGWFVGNIKGVKRLGVPTLNMQDNGNGFRTTESYMVGTVTCWPSALSMAATWDEKLVHNGAVAMGFEFATKGANVILGPGVFIARVAKGGRNFETLAGEDPYLGSKLGAQWVAGVQSQGIIATLKHYVFNNQETNRNSFNANVDDKTAWELYYPPFQAGVDAGAGAVMCSYNQQDGKHSCSNPRRLEDDLKDTMGFRGFVMSDWGAEHGTSIADGEDMDMVNGQGSDSFNANSVSEVAVDAAVIRTLASMYKMHLENTTKCSGGACSGPLHADAQKDHHDLAKQAATESIVLLKNDGDLLPLKNATVKTIRIVGSAATAGIANPFKDWRAADLYSGGGSGHVVPGYHVTPLDGIKNRAKAAGIQVLDESSDAQADVTIVVAGTTSAESYDRSHLHLDDNADSLIESLAPTERILARRMSFNATTSAADACSNYCSATGCSWTSDWACPWETGPGAKGYAKDDGTNGFSCCCKKRTKASDPCGGSTPSPSPPSPSAWSQHKGYNCYSGHGATEIDHGTGPVGTGITAAECQAKCDDTAGCTGVTYGASGGDAQKCWRRKDIQLSACLTGSHYDTYVKSSGPSPPPAPPAPPSPPAKEGKVVVLLQVPGAILMPWKNKVEAIATSFYMGQETGNAWASVLFGDYAPTGHLPISMPASEGDTIEPSSSGSFSYPEGLSVGYRNKQKRSSFAFGHGITYTNFTYSGAKSSVCGQSFCVQFNLKNSGKVAAATVPQLYLEFPSEAKQPAAILKGFKKTQVMAPGSKLSVKFELTNKDFSYWDSTWKQVSSATAHIGASSEDIRLTVPVKSTSSPDVIVV